MSHHAYACNEFINLNRVFYLSNWCTTRLL